MNDAPSSSKTLTESEESTRRLLQQVFEIWINPEIEKRQRDGLIISPFSLYMAQVVFDLDVDRPIVRLNAEVQAVMTARVKRAVEKGEAVALSDFDEIVSIELTDRDPNAGHITVILHQDAWFVSFNTQYNAQRVAETISTAEKFLASAKTALCDKRYRVFVDNLFRSVESLAKATLLSFPDKTLLKSKTHNTIQSKFNAWSKLGNIEREYADLLNQLKELRKDARYTMEPWSLPEENAHQMLVSADKLLHSVKARAPKRNVIAN